MKEKQIHRFMWGMSEEAQVWVVHFGSKSTPLIAQALRSIGLKSRVLNAEHLPHALAFAPDPPKLVILSGGDQSVYDANALSIPDGTFSRLRLHSVVFGICYGLQLLAKLAGGEVRRAEVGEYATVHVESRPFGGYTGGRAIMNHGDEITSLPADWNVIASTKLCKHALVGDGHLWGAQFHPEMGHTKGGTDLLRHVAYDIAGCRSDYRFDLERFCGEAAIWMEEVGRNEDMICGVSGGVDSSVAFKLAQRTSSRTRGIYIDNGWFRENETEEVRGVFGDRDMSYVDASKEFYDRIDDIVYRDEGSYYEAVRKAIGACFIDVFLREACKMEIQPKALIQGTNAADVIESVTGLKSHHNVGGLPAHLGVDVVEPLAGLYKSEIRMLAEYLHLPSEIVYRQPFPGPGLALRASGPLKRSYAPPLRRANRILEEAVRKHYPTCAARPCQYYAALLPFFTTGLVGDDRVLGFSWLVRMVWSEDRESYASLDVRPLSQEFQDEIAARLTAEVRMPDGTRFVRVFYELTGKPPSTTEPH